MALQHPLSLIILSPSTRPNWEQKFIRKNTQRIRYTDVGKLCGYFQSVKCFKFDFQGKNIDCVNDCDATKAFAAKLELGIVEFKKEMQLPFLN